jgi:hypothetical protein
MAKTDSKDNSCQGLYKYPFSGWSDYDKPTSEGFVNAICKDIEDAFFVDQLCLEIENHLRQFDN